MRNHRIIFGLMAAAFLAFAPLSALAAALTSSYTATVGGADVSITNNGADALYNVTLQPMGPGVAAGVAPINIGAIAAGGTVRVPLGGGMPGGYIALQGSATDVGGQAVQISVISEGR
ncbi:MAG: hypothetical protein Q9M23_03740 [Mariprofundaceae bacterium]|nr:hypothetical protein [Mariprofundaceae bacterium]